MEHKDKKINLDLDFLEEGASEKSENKDNNGKEQKTKDIEPKEIDTPISNTTKWVWGAIGIAVLFIIIATSSGDNNTTKTDTTNATNSALLSDTNTSSTDSSIPVVEKTKTDDELCKENYGPNSFSTEKKNADGGPICDCSSGYQWNDSQTKCVAAPKVKTGLEICQERNGYNATYDSASNSCGCTTGYYLGDISQKCISFTAARDENCESSYPGTSFLKYDTTDSKNICDCKAGYYWNNDRTACYSLTAFNQSCISAYGTGAYSTTENGKRVCDCTFGYDWNNLRTMCVTTASINAICERDVGRNSRYDGTVTNGKYNCTEPY